MDKAKHGDKQRGPKARPGKSQQADPRRPDFDQLQDDTARQDDPGFDKPKRQPGSFEQVDEERGAGIDRPDDERKGERSDRDAGAGRPVQLDDDEDGSLARR